MEMNEIMQLIFIAGLVILPILALFTHPVWNPRSRVPSQPKTCSDPVAKITPQSISNLFFLATKTGEEIYQYEFIDPRDKRKHRQVLLFIDNSLFIVQSMMNDQRFSLEPNDYNNKLYAAIDIPKDQIIKWFQEGLFGPNRNSEQQSVYDENIVNLTGKSGQWDSVFSNYSLMLRKKEMALQSEENARKAKAEAEKRQRETEKLNKVHQYLSQGEKGLSKAENPNNVAKDNSLSRS